MRGFGAKLKLQIHRAAEQWSPGPLRMRSSRTTRSAPSRLSRRTRGSVRFDDRLTPALTWSGNTGPPATGLLRLIRSERPGRLLVDDRIHAEPARRCAGTDASGDGKGCGAPGGSGDGNAGPAPAVSPSTDPSSSPSAGLSI
jgi:hypothetical protein